MTGCTTGFSDGKFKKLQASFNDKTKRRIDEMIDNELKEDNWLNDNSLCLDSKDDHSDCKRKRQHKGKHYCINCGESWI